MNRKLPVRQVEKPWGRDILPSPFVAPPGTRIGEIWFEPPTELDGLLVKYIFTSEALSVQVHPSDAQTQAAGVGRQGKEECWLIIDAEPGAKLGIGTKTTVDRSTLHQAALDGSIEQLLHWHEVKAGDFFYIPANTIHAIGAGISLIEVQQNSDITYRLYDYGRARELHLEDGLAVAKGAPHPANHQQHVSVNQTVSLVDGPLFRLDQLRGPPGAEVLARYGFAPILIVPVSGTAFLGDKAIMVGECAIARAIGDLDLPDDACVLIAQPA